MLDVEQDGLTNLELDWILLRTAALRSSDSERFLSPIKII
jgi:hypothetical protein